MKTSALARDGWCIYVHCAPRTHSAHFSPEWANNNEMKWYDMNETLAHFAQNSRMENGAYSLISLSLVSSVVVSISIHRHIAHWKWYEYENGREKRKRGDTRGTKAKRVVAKNAAQHKNRNDEWRWQRRRWWEIWTKGKRSRKATPENWIEFQCCSLSAHRQA